MSWRAALMVAVLLPASTPFAVDVGAGLQDDDRQGRAERPTGALTEELGRALGMTPAEAEALGLSPAEMRNLLAGFAQETVVVGSRAEPRSATESAVPVDVLSARDLASRGAGDLKDQLRTIIPSFSVNSQPINGGSTVVRPAMLRNLAPDHTLVLVNGKRRHRSSIFDWHGGNGVAFGSQGPDIAAIPSIALRQVEVLRDGAAAHASLGPTSPNAFYIGANRQRDVNVNLDVSYAVTRSAYRHRASRRLYPLAQTTP